MLVTLDFETEAIVENSPLPPKPVGLAVKLEGEPAEYFAFGHPTGNNSTWDEVRTVLSQAMDYTCAFHNAKFDLAVMQHWFDLVPEDYQDTLLLAFLVEPNSKALGLKPLADKYLNLPPDEQTDLKDWILANVKGATDSNWGSHIAAAPGDIVAPYARGDVLRTELLYHKFKPIIDADELKCEGKKNSLQTGYETELQLVGVIRDMERHGLRLSPNIADAHSYWHGVYDGIEAELHKYVGQDCKLGGKTMFQKLGQLGFLDSTKIKYTEKNNPKFGRDELPALITDEPLRSLLVKRSRLTKILGTYLDPWTLSAATYNGRLHPYFNSTRNDHDSGTRTGRFSSNLQQIPKSPHEGLPNLRSLILPDEGEILIVRDFAAQEIRVAAHFADSKLMAAYNENPDMDVHDLVQELIMKAVGYDVPRRISKTITFLKLYGGGPKKLVEQIGCTSDEARGFFEAYDQALPEFKQLAIDVEKLVRSGTKIRTSGGRLYDVEPPFVLPNGRKLEKYYKLSNTLIQGSSADMTKQAAIRYTDHPGRRGKLILQVHDELVCTVAKERLEWEMEILRWAMEDQPGWDVPIRSAGEWGENYGNLQKYTG